MIAALLAVSLAAGNAQDLAVPLATTAEVVLDGKIHGPEWASAKSVELGRGVVLLMMADKERLALAVESGGKRYTDLFVVRSEGVILNMHASMQAGERELTGRNWTDADPPTAWGNNARWQASVVRWRAGADPNAPFAEQVAPFDGQELLIERSLIPSAQWTVRIEARDFTGADADVVWPGAASRFDPSGWAEIVLP